MKKPEVTRVIGCQGSIQLITATNAVLCHQKPDSAHYKNYLLVYELYAPHGQDVDFFEFIKKLASTGPLAFEKILYLPPPVMERIKHEFLTNGVNKARETMRSITGIEKADELFLTSNWHPGNKILMHSIPWQTSVCYGDSIGLFIPEGYFADKRMSTSLKKIGIINFISEAVQAIKLYLQYPSRRPRLKLLKPVKFTVGYYLTLGLTKGKPKWPVTFTNKRTLMDTFYKYRQGLTSDFFDDPILNGSRLAFCLTTNFSEAGKMTLESEMRAYLEYLKLHLKKGSTIIIKPHPRDSTRKLERLREVLLADYKVKILDNYQDFFVPFELTLIRLMGNDSHQLERWSFHTFSSACLSIKILFGKDPHLGMGSELVAKYFEAGYQSSRKKHEEDLKRLLAANYE